MRIELPECKRCCCCVPLRYGLIAWTYIRMMYLLPMIVMMTWSLYRTAVGDYPYRRSATEIAFQIGFLVWLVLDVIFNTIFLVGSHTKNVKLLKVQYYYNMVSLVVFALLVVVGFVDLVYNHFRIFFLYHHGLMMLMANLSGALLGIVIQVYILLLTRSEIRKLTNNMEFRFENHAAGAQCVATIADKPCVDPYKTVPTA